MSVVADALALAHKDLVAELRVRQASASALAVSAIALVLVGLAVGPDAERLRTLAPALVWISLLYAAIGVAERLERIDRADDAFTGLWLVLADRRSIYVGRVLSLSVVLAVLQLALWAGAAFLLDMPVTMATALLVPVAALAAVAAGAAIALVVALVAEAGHRALLLPVALLPLLVPILLAGVQASAAIVEGRVADAAGWAGILVIEAALFFGLGLLTYEGAAGPA